MAKNNSLTSAPNAYSSSYAEVEATQTLEKMREEMEKELASQKFLNTQKYFTNNQEAEKKLHSLNMNDSRELNDYRINLEREYADKVRLNRVSQADADKAIAKEVQEYTYQLSVKSHTQELQQSKSLYQQRLKDHQEYLDAVQKSQIKATDAEIAESKRAIEATKKEYASSLGLNENNPLRGLVTGQGASVREYLQGVTESGTATAGETALAGVLDNFEEGLNSVINNFASEFESIISTYSGYQTIVNTRLQGTGLRWNGVNGIEANISNAVGTNAYVSLQAVMDNVVAAVQSGIAYNIELRAFLQTVSDEIAETFDAFDSNLTRLIRIQQSDSTAARLGMEASLTQFYNGLFSDTSYLSDAFDSVSSSLTEAISTMGTEMGVEFEYTVQKWLGSLYSVGMSQGAVTEIAQALGYLGSGNASALTGSSAGQLLILAAANAGLNVGDILTTGLTSSTTNQLLEAMVVYLQQISANSDSLAQESAWADKFGMSISDITAAVNVYSSLADISGAGLSYIGAVNELYSQMGQLNERVSVGGMVSNMLENVQYSIGSGIASNAVTYALWEVTSLIEDLTGGINLPTVSIMGNAVDLNTTVTNLMRSGIVGVSTLGAIGDIINGVSGTVNPASILDRLGLSTSVSVNTRGSVGTGTSRVSGATSSSAIIGNASGEDYYQQSLTAANEQTNSTLVQAQEESEAKTLDDIHDYLVGSLDPMISSIDNNILTLVNQSYELLGGAGISGYSVRISAVDTENYLTQAENLKTITSSVSGILEILNSVVSNGSLKVQFSRLSSGEVGF